MDELNLPSTLDLNETIQDKLILVVDDDEMVLNTIERILQTVKASCVTVGGGIAALSYLRHNRPNLILLDYMMPDMSGAEVVAAIAEQPDLEACRNVPIVMLTAKTSNYAEQTELLKKGLSAYLFKPFGHRELINVISNLLTIHEVQEENKRLTDSVRQMQVYLQSILDNITDSISVQDKQYRIERVNQGTHDLFGSDPDGKNRGKSFEGRSCHKAYFDFDRPCAACPARETLATGQPSFSEFQDYQTGRFYEINTYPLFNKDHETVSFIETIRDVTGKKQLEAQLIESSRLASVGTLAAGVAHEINNPLCIILGFTQSLLEETDLNASTHDELKIIENETSRCAQVVQDLLTYAKPGPLKKEDADLPDLVRKSLGLLRYQMKKKEIRVSEKITNKIPKIGIDKNKIQQVVVNVLLNAVQASAMGGAIHISVKASDGFVSLEIRDSGEGISREDLKRIFDPFYSTKKSHGTGLGLSMSKTIVNDHGGSIEICSTPGKGTNTKISLPSFRETAAVKEES